MDQPEELRIDLDRNRNPGQTPSMKKDKQETMALKLNVLAVTR